LPIGARGKGFQIARASSTTLMPNQASARPANDLRLIHSPQRRARNTVTRVVATFVDRPAEIAQAIDIVTGQADSLSAKLFGSEVHVAAAQLTAARLGSTISGQFGFDCPVRYNPVQC
jgi:hypothetical protein